MRSKKPARTAVPVPARAMRAAYRTRAALGGQRLLVEGVQQVQRAAQPTRGKRAKRSQRLRTRRCS